MPAEQNGRQVEVAEHGVVVAVADVEPTDDQGVVRASLHAQAGHLPTGARTRLVDAVLDLPQTQDSNRLEATLPLGDAESLDRLRERCDEVQARPAGASCLVDAALPADARGAPEPRSLSPDPRAGDSAGSPAVRQSANGGDRGCVTGRSSSDRRAISRPTQPPPTTTSPRATTTGQRGAQPRPSTTKAPG